VIRSDLVRSGGFWYGLVCSGVLLCSGGFWYGLVGSAVLVSSVARSACFLWLLMSGGAF
jgi:hypothetical protein